MKKNNSSEKKMMLIIAVVFLHFSALAQAVGDSAGSYYRSTYQSLWTKYNNINEEFSIVRSNSSNHVVYLGEVEHFPNELHIAAPHTFIIKDYATSAEVAFTTTFGCNSGLENPCSDVIISDMRLYDDTCYFCGTCMGEKNSETSRRGFVGRFVPREIIDGTGKVYYHISDSAKQLTRLAISKHNSTLVISAIGNVIGTAAPCILELTYDSNTWKEVLDTIHENYGMIFSDIMTIRDSLTLLAQFECSNDNLVGSQDYDFRHQIFLLDRFGLSGCHASYNPSWIHYMAHYLIPADEDYNFHHNKAPMRLFHINDRMNEFGVAFGVEEWDEEHGGIRLFQFPHGWNFSNSIYYRTGRNAVIKDIGNMYGTDSIYVLSKDNSYPNGFITKIRMDNASPSITWLTNNTYTFNSLTQKFAGGHIDISGHGVGFVFHLFDQYIPSLSMQSCFDKATRQKEELRTWRSTQLVVHWEFHKMKKEAVWIEAPTTDIQISPTTVCSKCN